MDEAFLTQVVKRVLAELGQTPPYLEPCMKKKLLILYDHPEGSQAKLDWICSNYVHEYEIFALRKAGDPQPSGIKSMDEGEVKQYKWDKVFLVSCSVDTLVKIALGLREGSSADLIGIALSKGTSVEIETPCFGFTQKTSESYKQLFEEYIKRVEGFGVVFRYLEKSNSELVSTDKIVMTKEFSTYTNSSSTVTPSQKVTRFEKHLLTERDANGFPEKTILLVEKGVILTPLAQDVLKRQNIELQYAEEG